MKGRKRGRDWVVYPFLLALYPSLMLFATNVEETPASSVIRPALISLFGAALLYCLAYLLIREANKAGIITTLILGWFFIYGHIYNSLENLQLAGIVIGRHRLLFPLWTLLFVVSLWRIWVNKHEYKEISRSLNLIAALLLVFPLVQLSLSASHNLAIAQQGSASAYSTHLRLPEGQPAPDIYYIILDGYTRDDILEKAYHIDNTPFLSELESMGFYVARCSQSNYAQTILSLASSLNLNYLETLGEQYTPGHTSRAGLAERIQHSAVRNALESLGYRLIALDSGYDATRIMDADVYLTGTRDAGINDFENLFIRTTAGRVISEGVSLLNLPPDWEKRDQAHRERILYALAQLPNIPEMSGNKFVFAHLVIPHWPHVFGPNGEAVHIHPDSASGYRDQVLFINQRIVPVLEEIISRSKTPPVIIVQGDHGSVIESPVRRMSILNAYYLPDGGKQAVYANISPVNSFRVVFNLYFGGNYPLLPDLSFYSIYQRPFDYTVIPDNRPGCQAKD